MRRVTATQARKNWFRILDEAAGGEEFVIQRNGVDIVVRRLKTPARKRTTDYSKLLEPLEGLDVSNLHRFTWVWDPDTGELMLRERPE